MAIILNIETSTPVCSVAISRNSELIAFRESFDDKSHASFLTVFIDEVLKESGLKPSDLNAIAISQGPGSYTGLRIGVSAAKGLCYALNIPLIAVNTLKAMAFMANEKTDFIPEIFCPMIDARRMEVYSALFDVTFNEVRHTMAEIIDNATYATLLAEKSVLFFGNGAFKCKEVITHSNAHFIENIHPLARYMYILSEQQYLAQDFVDVAYYEPFYLKDFVATVPKNRLT